MVQFNTLKQGDILWRRSTTTVGGTRLRTSTCVAVKVIQVDKVTSRVQAQWGSNPPRWYGAESCNEWHRNKPAGVAESIFTTAALRK